MHPHPSDGRPPSALVVLVGYPVCLALAGAMTGIFAAACYWTFRLLTGV